LLILGVIRYGVNVPFWDQWELVPLFEKYHQGTLTLLDLAALHNEHRVLFPRMIDLSLAVLTRWNIRAELLVSLGIMLAAGALLLLLIKREFGRESWVAAAVTFAVSGLFYSTIQWENWLWGWEVGWFLLVTMLITAVWALTNSAWSHSRSLAVAAMAAFVATYSLANGMLLWFVLLPALFLLRYSLALKALWGLIAVVSIGLYYLGYQVPPGAYPKTLALHHPLAFLQYALAYIGRPLGAGPFNSAIAGAGLIFVFVTSVGYLCWRRRTLVPLTPWLTLALFSLISGGVTAFSRLGFGVEQALSSRYATVSTLFVISTLVVGTLAVCDLYSQHRNSPMRRMLIRVVVGVAIAGGACDFTWNYLRGIRQMQEQSAHLQEVRQCLQTVSNSGEDCLLIAYPIKDIVWKRLQYLRQIHWGGF